MMQSIDLSGFDIEGLVNPYVSIFQKGIESLIIVECLIAIAIIVIMLLVYFNLRNKIKDIDSKFENHIVFINEMYDEQNYLFNKIIKCLKDSKQDMKFMKESLNGLDMSKSFNERLGIDLISTAPPINKIAPNKPISVLTKGEVKSINLQKKMRNKKENHNEGNSNS